MPAVTNEPLYHAVHNAVSNAIERDAFPTLMIFAGKHIVRASDKRYVLVNNQLTHKKLEECLIVRDGSSADGNYNRFSGRAPDSAVSVGGVYFSMHNTPMFMELRHYNADRSVNGALRGKVVLDLEVTNELNVFDLSRHSAAADKFLQKISQDPAVQKAAKTRSVSIRNLMLSPNDFSVSKAIGMAVGRHPIFDGLLVPTARTNNDSLTGDNLVLFGNHGKLVTRKLKIVGAYLFKLKKGPQELDFQRFTVTNGRVTPA